MKYISYELRHYIKRPAFWLSIGVTLFCFLFEHRDYFSFYLSGELLYYLDAFYLFVIPFEYGLFFYLVPLIAIPPAALSIIDDHTTGYVRQKLYRTSRSTYIVKRLLSISIGSMLPMMIGCVLFLLLSLFSGPLSGEHGLAMQANSSAQLQPLALAYDGIPYIIFVIGQATLTAWLWGMIGTLLALITNNKGTTLMNGFMLFWGGDCLCHYLGFEQWRPYLLFFSSLQNNASLWSSWIKTIVLLAVTIGINAALMNSRYKKL